VEDVMIILSSRDSMILRENLLSLRRQRNQLEEKIERLKNVSNPKYIEELEESLNYIEYQIKEGEDAEDRLDPSRVDRRKREQSEIRMLGFTMVEHGEHQYNQRFSPQMDRTSLMKFLYDLGLGQKIPNRRHHIIKLMNNFHVAVEDFKVLTFKYDDQYYNHYHGNPPKVDLKKVQ
jgi:hypothetical protein